MKLSVIVIAKNAENEIVDALTSVGFADEVVVIDSGSTDRTVDIAKRLKAKVFEHISKDFSDMRNYGLKKTEGEWVLYIDTDEKVTDSLRENIKYQISRSKNDRPLAENTVAFKIKRKNFYFGKHEWPYIEEMERLFKKEELKGWQGNLHETPVVNGKMGILDGFLLHYTHRDLTSMLEKTIEWSKVEAELRIKVNHPKMAWWRFFRVMTTAFFSSYIKQGGWKKGTVGLIESFYQSFSMFVTYARLWEMQKK